MWESRSRIVRKVGNTVWESGAELFGKLGIQCGKAEPSLLVWKYSVGKPEPSLLV
jgi:hypothetical protein